jgi:hypothetical protein
MPVDQRLKFAFMQLVLERSVSIAQAARRYGRHERAIRNWCGVAPISVRVAGGSRRVSLPLADLYAAGEHRALWRLLDGDVAQIVADAFVTYGMGGCWTVTRRKLATLALAAILTSRRAGSPDSFAVVRM